MRAADDVNKGVAQEENISEFINYLLNEEKGVASGKLPVLKYAKAGEKTNSDNIFFMV